jgi:hypothetical protein
VVLSHLRFASGVCVLFTGLLIGAGGGAIAMADSGHHGSTTRGTGGAEGSSLGRGPARRVTDTAPKTLPGVTNTLGSGRSPGLAPSSGPKSPKTGPGGPDPTDEKNGPRTATTVPNAPAPVPSAPAPVRNAAAPPPNLVAPVLDRPAPLLNAVVSVPIGLSVDAIAAFKAVLTSVADGSSTQPPDIPSLLDVTGAQPGPPVMTGSRSVDARVPAPPDPPGLAGPSAAPQSLPAPLASAPGAPAAGNPTGVAALTGRATTHVGPVSSEPATLAQHGASSLHQMLHVTPVVSQVLRSATLWELAAAALPGVGGFVFFTGAGMGVGRRQAKAEFALRTAGIATFARPGPLGVVRSKSLVVIRRAPLRAQHVVEEAA